MLCPPSDKLNANVKDDISINVDLLQVAVSLIFNAGQWVLLVCSEFVKCIIGGYMA